MSNNESLILEILTNEASPLRPGDIANRAKLDKSEVSPIIKKLKAEGKIYSPKRCFYSISE